MNTNDVTKELDKLSREKSELERLNNDLNAKILELYSLYNISKMTNLSFTVEEIFSNTITIIGQTLQIDEFCIMLIDEKCQDLVVRAWYPDPGALSEIRFKIGEGIAGMVARTGKINIIQDVSKESNFLFYKGAKTDIGAFMCVPLVGKKGNTLGVFNVHKALPNSFTDNDIKFFSEVAEQVAAAVEKAILYQKTKEASMRDDLTGLYNRRYFFEYFEKESSRANRYNKCFSILMLDIDNFKNFNDKNGHLKGDDVMRQMARLLVCKLRYSDIVARYGGEEFICLLPETPKQAAAIAAEKLRKAVEGYQYDGGENQPGGRVTITIGVATWPDDAQFNSELIDYADKAMYVGKKQGKNMVCSKIEV